MKPINAMNLEELADFLLQFSTGDLYGAKIAEVASSLRNMHNGTKGIPFELIEQDSDFKHRTLKGEIILGRDIDIRAEGYGDCSSANGHGTPVLIELYHHDMRVILWSDINQEDPTHIVNMGYARESFRKA